MEASILSPEQQLLDEGAELRTQGQYEAAIAKLEHAMHATRMSGDKELRVFVGRELLICFILSEQYGCADYILNQMMSDESLTPLWRGRFRRLSALRFVMSAGYVGERHPDLTRAGEEGMMAFEELSSADPAELADCLSVVFQAHFAAGYHTFSLSIAREAFSLFRAYESDESRMAALEHGVKMACAYAISGQKVHARAQYGHWERLARESGADHHAETLELVMDWCLGGGTTVEELKTRMF